MRALQQRLAIHRRIRAFQQWERLALSLAQGVPFSAVETRRWSVDSFPAALREKAFVVQAREVEQVSTRSWGLGALARQVPSG